MKAELLEPRRSAKAKPSLRPNSLAAMSLEFTFRFKSFIRYLLLSIVCETLCEPKLLAFDWDILKTSLNQ
jgi:hypothetical protein